jgi:hypothetical protein
MFDLAVVEISEMLRMLNEPEQSEDDLLDSHHKSYQESFHHPMELNFPWPLINAFRAAVSAVRSKPSLLKYVLVSFYSQLIVVFIISILCITFGGVFINNCSDTRMVCIIFIVQGSSELFVVLIYTWTTMSG